MHTQTYNSLPHPTTAGSTCIMPRKKSKNTKERKFSPLYPKVAGLVIDKPPPLRFHIAVSTYNCSIASHQKLGAHPLQTPSIHSYKPANTQTVIHGINQPLPWSTYYVTTYRHSHTYILSLPILSIWPNHWRILLSILLYTPSTTMHNLLFSGFSTLSILPISNRPLSLSICRALILELSFSHIPPSHTQAANPNINQGSNDTCNFPAPSCVTWECLYTFNPKQT